MHPRRQGVMAAVRRRLVRAAAAAAAVATVAGVLSGWPSLAQETPADGLPGSPQEAVAQDPPALPDIRRRNGVDYLSGGVGIDESRAIHEAASSWPLKITMAEMNNGRAVWISDAEVRIRDARSRPVLEFRSDGPLALVRLIPGRYTVEARFNGISQTRDVIIVSGTPQKIMIVWKLTLR